MNEKDKMKAVTVALSFFFALPGLLVTAAIRLGPAWIENDLPPLFTRPAMPLSVVCFLAVFLVFYSIFRIRRFPVFAVVVFVAVLFLTLSMFYLGVSAHRDYFTAVFQYIFIVPAVFLYRISSVPELRIPRNALRQFSRAGYVIAILYAQWIMLMGYAIATRAEPRPVESLAYNIYNLILALVMFILSRGVEGRFFHHVFITSDSFLVDGKDIASMLGAKKVRIMRAFADADNGTLRCHELQRLEDSLEGAGICERCGEETTKAALCRKYRTTYNSLLEIKKALEFFEIGTIISPDNKRRVLTDGWKLSFFDNVRVRVRK